jgi:sugar phosphate isomerase/epimerase
MTEPTSRRDALLLGLTALSGAAFGLSGCMTSSKPAPVAATPAAGKKPLFPISLAQWSLHRALYAKEMTNLDFPRIAKRTYGIDGVEYVNSFWKDKASDQSYLKELKGVCDGEGVQSVLIMCDGEGNLGDPDNAARAKAVENHYRWVDAAKYLGCHSIRVNAQSKGTWDEQMKLAADGLRRLCEFGDTRGINVIVENHGGLSSNAEWMTATIRMVNHPRSGLLPDFGNYENATDDKGNRIPFDRYRGCELSMPFARGVSAKSHDFDDAGNEIHTDYAKMLHIVLKAGYRGRIGVEYEGDKISEDAGIRATKALVERLRDQFTQSGEFV